MLSFPELNQKDFFNDVNVEQEILELDEEILSTEGSKQIVPQVIDTPGLFYKTNFSNFQEHLPINFITFPYFDSFLSKLYVTFLRINICRFAFGHFSWHF